MADITNKNIQIPGVNSDTNYVQERAYMLNMNTNADIASVGTHKIVALPEGEALVGLKVIVVEGITSGGAATVQFKLNDAAINSSALALAGLATGYVHKLNVAGLKGYGANTLQLTIGTAAITGGKIMVIAETIPVNMFITNG
jgi:hypothetical protein